MTLKNTNMKTSNIIVLSTSVFVLILSVTLMIEARSTFDTFQTTENTELETIQLQNFSHIVLNDETYVKINFENENSYEQFKNRDNALVLRNDTLFISEKSHLNLNCRHLKSIHLNDESELKMEGIDSKYLMVSAKDDSRLTANHSEIEKLDLYTEKEARVIFNKSDIDTTNILAIEESRIGVNGALGVMRGEVKGNSNLSISGAKNTQFSKTDNAQIDMK